MGAKRSANVVLGNYIDSIRRPRTVKDSLAIGATERSGKWRRNWLNSLLTSSSARLPKDEEEERRLIRTGYELARQMSWDAVAERFVFPLDPAGLRTAARAQCRLNAALRVHIQLPGPETADRRSQADAPRRVEQVRELPRRGR